MLSIARNRAIIQDKSLLRNSLIREFLILLYIKELNMKAKSVTKYNNEYLLFLMPFRH